MRGGGVGETSGTPPVDEEKALGSDRTLTDLPKRRTSRRARGRKLCLLSVPPSTDEDYRNLSEVPFRFETFGELR